MKLRSEKNTEGAKDRKEAWLGEKRKGKEKKILINLSDCLTVHRLLLFINSSEAMAD